MANLPAVNAPSTSGGACGCANCAQLQNMLSIGGKEKHDAKLFLMRSMGWRVADIGGPEEPGFVEVVQEAAHRLYNHSGQQKRLEQPAPNMIEIVEVSHDQDPE